MQIHELPTGSLSQSMYMAFDDSINTVKATIESLIAIVGTALHIKAGSASGSVKTSGTTAEGSSYTIGTNAACFGANTQAKGAAQLVAGKYNVADANGDYAVVIGNGSSGSRSNAFALEWGGNMLIALNTSAGSSTVDGKLYAAIDALGWASGVID